jgi:hypothetical protein
VGSVDILWDDFSEDKNIGNMLDFGATLHYFFYLGHIFYYFFFVVSL